MRPRQGSGRRKVDRATSKAPSDDPAVASRAIVGSAIGASGLALITAAHAAQIELAGWSADVGAIDSKPELPDDFGPDGWPL